GADGRHHPFRAVHRRTGEPGDAGAVQGISYAEGDGRGLPARAGGVDPDDGILSQQGEVDPGRGTGGGEGVRQQGAADDGGAAAAARGGAEDGKRGAGIVVRDRRGGGG